jgi:hypothetical protein
LILAREPGKPQPQELLVTVPRDIDIVTILGTYCGGLINPNGINRRPVAVAPAGHRADNLFKRPLLAIEPRLGQNPADVPSIA